jgi:hypothetical protein
MNFICVNCKEIYPYEPVVCNECGGKSFERTHAKTIKQNTLAALHISFSEGNINMPDALNKAYNLGKLKVGIQWFSVDQPPPINDVIEHASEYVLIYQPGLLPVPGYYNHESKFWIHANHWQPTHYAYINLPE